jgi:hypothetical protein
VQYARIRRGGAAQSIKWRNPKHRSQLLNTMKTFVYPILGKLPVAAKDTPLVLKVLEQHVTAERGYCGNLKHLIPAADETRTVRHHAAPPYNEIAAFMSRLSEREAVAARAL